MKDIRIFVASSKELERERNELAFLVLAKEEEFAARGLRVRLAKWEYVDPRLTGARTEDRYLDEMYDCDAAFVLFRNIAGMYTREELDKALAKEREGTTRLKAHSILFAADGEADYDAAKLRAELPEGSYGVWSGMEELRTAFLSLVDRVSECEGLVEAPSEKFLRKITAFLAADDELAEERNAFADTVLNVNELLEQAHRNIRVQLKFYDPANAESVIESSEMGLVLYGTNYRVFGRTELERIYARVKDGRGNPKRFYVFFRDLDEATEKSLDETFKAFRSDFVTKLGHFTCQFGDANALRLGFLLSLERYAGETVEIYSTVGTPTAPVFVGRENALRKLCGLLEPVPGRFPAGRLPIITGAGGTGKSELVRQYASQLRVQYPGGVFQVDMEHLKTWDEAFLGLLDGVSNNGIRVRDYLEIEDETGNGKQAEPIIGAQVRDALLKKARKSGPALLVLDNVEGCLPLLGRAGGFEKAFPAGFSERVLVNVVATARVCDAVLRPVDWGVEFPLGDLSRDDALALLLGERPDVDDKEREAAGRVAELLGYRALYLRAIPALLDNVYSPYAGSFACLEEALRESLLETVGEGMEEAADGGRTPSALWEMTRKTLTAQPGGRSWVRLAQIAAFCPPDGFPSRILRYLWGDLAAPEKKVDRFFDQALLVLRKHGLLSGGDEALSMHRLTRAAIQEDARVEWPDIENQMGISLAKHPIMSQEDWSGFFWSLKIIRHIPSDMLDGNLVGWFLSRTPGYDAICPWNRLTARDWPLVLNAQPSFARKCPWRKLNGHALALILCRQPQFEDKCSLEQLDGDDWARLLGHQPQFADKCRWEELEGNDWARLLGAQPQFADKCRWEELGGKDWAKLLGVQPQFEKKCAWEKLDEEDWGELLGFQPQFADKCPWEQLDGGDWARLLGNQPQFAERCPWENLDGRNWARLLGAQPQFAYKCPWEKLGGDDWAELLGAQPQFAERCPWKNLGGRNWARLLGDQPQFADKCPWEELGGGDWTELLIPQPQFAGKCPWEKLEGGNWRTLLAFQPQLANKCSWEKLDGNDWSNLLFGQQQFANKCAWEKLDGADWAELLAVQSQFADRCSWEKLDRNDWNRLLFGQQQGEDTCLWEKLDAKGWKELFADYPQLATKFPWKELSGAAWISLLGEQPQFGDLCPWDKLEVDGHDWTVLLCKQPQFADKCRWEDLGGEDLAELLDVQPQLAEKCVWEKLDGYDWGVLLGALPQYANKCPWEKLDAEGWTCILRAAPQFADKCPWDELDGGHWGWLLESQPQFSDRCDWNKLGSGDWANLLGAQPQFAGRCPWTSLDGGDWADLLSHQPQFADNCPWEKLDGKNWVQLLGFRPQFADQCTWEKLGGGDWVRLLAGGPGTGRALAQPQFAGHCDWAKLTGRNWSALLVRAPQFAEHCDWTKLADGDWEKLLGKQPQFAGHRAGGDGP